MPPSPDPESYRLRRERVCAAMREHGGVLVLHGGRLETRAHDTEFPFRPDSDFHYLTGLSEPNAIMVLRAGREPADDRFVLFVRPRDADAERWSGRRVGPQGAKERFGASEAHALSALARKLPELLEGCACVHLPLGRTPDLDRGVLAAIDHLRRQNRDGARAPVAVHDTRELLGEERVRKDAAALTSLKKAIALSAEAHTLAMRRTRPGMFEYQVQALIEHHFRHHGSSGPGYGSIVGGGDNATILHYVDNRDPLRDGELLLIDAGAEWDYFSGDITRSWPINGRFTGPQRDLYEVVLAANERGIERCVPGETIDSIHEACLEVLVSGMRELGLLEESVEEILERKLYRRYYMHRTSHWLGVDVHDAGDYCRDGRPRPLEPGFVLTVEPALYVPAEDERAPEALRGIGVRVEDDVLVTPGAPEVLSAACPKRVDALEGIIGSEA